MQLKCSIQKRDIFKKAIQSKTSCWKQKILEYFSNIKHIEITTIGRIFMWKHANKNITYIAAFQCYGLLDFRELSKLESFYC